MEVNKANNELLKLLKNLKTGTFDLRSAMTIVILCVEESDHLSQEEKDSILNAIQAVSKKNSELISAENQLIQALNLSLDQPDFRT